MTTRWSDDELQAARRRGDPPVDDVVATVLDKAGGDSRGGRLGYNYLLRIADTLLEAPWLSAVDGSRAQSTLSKELEQYPKDLVEYFDPIEAPPWLNTRKLARAGELWNENVIAMIGVLYAASLPACYLIKRGIPALYDTAKLREARYIYQRIYETGVFLEDVMSPGGFEVVTDIDEGFEAYVAQARGTTTPSLESRPAPRRFLWGRGYIAAKKVRFLHSSMRFMLMRPGRMTPFRAGEAPSGVTEALSHVDTAWDVNEFGVPINQEDLAYTLLTFSYLIPIGLEKWGCAWTDRQRSDFLHLWKLVGYLMGIEETFLTDQWDEAAELFEATRSRQAGASTQGKALTDAVMGFLADYLPSTFGIDQDLPALLIEQQIGQPYADMIFSVRPARACRRVVPRIMLGIGLGLLRTYYVVRNWVFARSGSCAELMGSMFAEAGRQLISSWRDAYRRRPFDVPANTDEWQRLDAANQDFLRRLREWRQRLFNVLGGGLGLLIAAVLCLAAGVVLFFLGHDAGWKVSAWLATGGFVASVLTLKVWLPRVSRQRPRPAGDGVGNDQ